MHGNTDGRVPFALVAVLLLMSAGVSAMFAAKLARDEASWRTREAQLDALGAVADATGAEVVAQAEFLAVGAIRRGTDGLVNESKIRQVFREDYRAYVESRFPRELRGVSIRVSDFGGDVHLVTRRLVDVTPPGATLRGLEGTNVAAPDPSAPDVWAEGDRLAYFAVSGHVNLTLSLGTAALTRDIPIAAFVPVPVPLMEGKVEQLARSGIGDLTGVGRTTKAILATLAQFRVLDGTASRARPETTTRDVLTPRDVELAVNLAILLEEIRLFRTYDRTAANAIDTAHAYAPGPSISSLLDRYAANGSVDAVDLYALAEGLDLRGLHLGTVLGQAVVALADDALLKHLDYLGLTPLADWMTQVAEGSAVAFEDFLRWLADRPSREVEYVLQFVDVLFAEANTPTTFLGAAAATIPKRSYGLANGSVAVEITIPAHGTSIGFTARDLRSRDLDAFWESYFPTFVGDATAVHAGVRDLANDIAANLAGDVVLAGLLSDTASGPVDPNDDETFLAAVARRVGEAVDTAVDWFRSDPTAVDVLMRNLWDAAKGMIARLVEHLVASYPMLSHEATEIGTAEADLAADLFARAAADPDFANLTDAQRAVLEGTIEDDVRASAWAATTFDGVRARDTDAWRLALAVTNGTGLPGSRSLRDKLREAAIGAGGWLVLARDAVHGMMREALRNEALGATAAKVATRLGPFELWDSREPGRRTTERFLVSHAPPELRIELRDPATIPMGPDTPNVHYTLPFERSRRPFATAWTVHVEGSVALRVETADRVLLGPHGFEPAAVEESWPLDFTLSLSAVSGWNLTGVAYHDSNTLLGDSWRLALSFLDRAWDALAPIVSWLLDVLRGVVRILLETLEPILSFARTVVEVLTEAIRAAADLLHDLAVGAVQGLLAIVDLVNDLFPDRWQFEFHFGGLSWRFTMNGGAGREFEVRVGTDAYAVGLVALDLLDAGYEAEVPYDALASWGVAMGPYRLDAALDPLMITQPNVVAGNAAWDDWWTMDFAGPVLEPILALEVSVPIGPIPVPPFGTVEFEVGVLLLMTVDPVDLFSELVERAIARAFDLIAGSAVSLDSVDRFASALSTRLAEDLVEALEGLEDAIVELSFYVEGEFDAGGGPFGAGFRLSFVADGTGLRDVLTWIAENVGAFVQNLLDPATPASYAALSPEIFAHLYLRGEAYVAIAPPKVVQHVLDTFAGPLGDLELRVSALVEANVALLGSIMGESWGAWEVNFGAYAEVPAPLAAAFGAPVGMSGDLWFLRGTFRAN